MGRFAKENVLRFLVGNKCDLEIKRKVTYEQGKELAKQYNINFLETSAKDTINIEELFTTTTKNYLEKQSSSGIKKDTKSPKNLKNSKSITMEQEKKKKGGCC
jgi:Ras-related protein Rab-1A